MKLRNAGLLCLMLLPLSPLRAGQPRNINVSDVEGLYRAVGSSGNEGVTIHLAPNRYVLSALDPAGHARPNAGVLRLQRGMALVGSEQRADLDGDGVPDPVDSSPDNFTMPGTETVIDGSNVHPDAVDVKDCAQDHSAGAEPVINLAPDTTIDSLSVIGGPNVTIGEGSSPVEPGAGLTVTITNDVLQGTGIVVTFGNTGCAARGARSSLLFAHNVVRDSTAPSTFSIVNLLNGNADDSTMGAAQLRATVSFNRFYRNATAFAARAGAQSTDGATMSIDLNGNIFTGNKVNMLLMAGFAKAVRPTIGNSLQVRSHGDRFGQAGGLGSVVIYGARKQGVGEPNGNALEANFIGARFIRDAATASPEFWILGSESGSGNTAEVLVRQAAVVSSAGAAASGVIVIQNELASGDGTNTARLIGSRTSFEATNDGFTAPADEFFHD